MLMGYPGSPRFVMYIERDTQRVEQSIHFSELCPSGVGDDDGTPPVTDARGQIFIVCTAG